MISAAFAAQAMNRHVEYIYRRRGNYLGVREVPCEVCLRCGERYYEGGTLVEIERHFKAIYEGHVTPQLTLNVPVVTYT